MSSYVNPSDDVKQNDGTAYVDSETVLAGGTAKNLGSNRTLLDNLAFGKADQQRYGKQVHNSASPPIADASFGSVATPDSISNDVVGGTTYVKIVDSSHGALVGDVIDVTDTNGVMNGTFVVIVVDDSGNFTINQVDKTGEGDIGYRIISSATSDANTEGTYVIRRIYTGLVSGGTNPTYRRSIHKVEAARHSGVTAAIRAGYWDVFSGSFSTLPSPANTSLGDVAGNNTTNIPDKDHEANASWTTGGEFVYRESGKPAATTGGALRSDYTAKG
jgi:hypothetical protein